MTFDEWIKKLDIDIVYNVTLTVKSSSETKTLYLSTHGDVYNGTYYEPYVVGIPRMARSMQEILFGRSMISWGELVLKNGDGFFDDYINGSTTWTFNGQDITIEAGNRDWTVSGTIFQGKMKDPEVTDTEIRIPVYDGQKRLEAKIPPNTFSASTNMPSSNVGSPIPLCFGYCKNITPVLIDDTTYTYQVHDGQITDVTAAYDDGVPVTIASKDLTNGTFTLSAAPSGFVTCDVSGATPGGTFLYKVGDIVEYLIKTYAQPVFDASEIDSTMLTQFNTDVPWEVGIYIDSKTTLLNVLDELVIPVLGAYGIGRDGKFQIWRIDVPGSSSDTEITDMEGHDGAFSAEFHPLILWKTSIGYDKNWTVQTTGIGDSVSLDRKEWLKKKYRYTSSEDSTIKNLYVLAEEKVVDTLLRNSDDADTLASRYLTLFGQKRMIITDKINLQVFGKNLSDDIKYSRDRYNLDGYYVLIDVEEDYDESETTIRLWG